MIELDFSFDLPDFDGLLDDLDLDISLDGIDLDFNLPDDLPLNRERTEKNDLLKIVEDSTDIARTPANPTPQKRSFWSP